MTTTYYTSRQAARAAGIPLRCLLGWCERGVVQPTIVAQGRGTRRQFTRRDILVLRAVAEVQRITGRHAGLGVIARTIAEELVGRRGGLLRIGDTTNLAALYVNLPLLGRAVDAALA